MVAMDQQVDLDCKSSGNTTKSISSWRSVLTSLKKQLKFLSPIRCLAATRDSYVKGMNSFASSSHCSTLMVQGPHIAPLSRSASRSVHDDDDDLYQLIRAASSRKSGLALGLDDDLGLGKKPLPRSASVSAAQQQSRVGSVRQQQQQQRSLSYSGMRFPIQRTVLESTQEE